MSFTRPGNIKGPDDFKPKRLVFDFPNNLKRFWNGGSYNRTYFFNSLGILSPSFERLFILSVLNYRRELKGTDLEKPMKAFLGQEAQHDKQIRRFNQSLKQFGYPVDQLEAANLAFCKKLNSLCKPITQLAFTMGAEHLISLLSDLNLKDELWFQGGDPKMAAIWRWHAIEEIEHKSVAYDVYHRLNGGYWRKVWGFVVVTSVIFGMWFHNWWAMVKKDKLYFKPRFWGETLSFLFFKPGLFRKLCWPMLRYFSPWFHPWQHDNRHLISQWGDYFESRHTSEELLEELGKPSFERG